MTLRQVGRWFAPAVALIMLVALVAAPSAQRGVEGDKQFQSALHKEMVDGDLKAAIEEYRRVSTRAGVARDVAAAALVRMADCYQKMGDAQALKVYEQLIRDYADQPDATATARARLSTLGPAPGGQAAKAARQVWSGPGVDGGGSPSPDGRYLSLTDWDTGDLAIRDLTTGTNRRLTNTGGWVKSGDYASESVISPDGLQVAYAWFVEKEFKNELRVVSTATGGPPPARTLKLTERTEYLKPVAWTPDNQRLIVERSLPDRTVQIGTVSVRDGSFQSLKSLEWRRPDRVSISPDGTFLAYDVPAGDNGSPRDIVVLATDGSREATVVRGPAEDGSPIWSPDGSHLLFLSNRTGSTSLWATAIISGSAVGSPVLMKADVGRVSLLGISRNGALYYYVGGGSRRNVYVADIAAGRVARPARLATENSVNSNSGPSWSRDGQYLAYFRGGRLVIQTVSSGDERVVPVPVGLTTPFSSGPKWFPDNRAVLILLRDAQGTGLGAYRLTLDSGKADLLWHLKQGTSSFDLSPDGKSIFAAFQNDDAPRESPAGTGRIVRYDIENGRETILKDREWFITLAVSPDGSQLAYLKTIRENTSQYPSALEVIPTAGGPSREVYRNAVWLGGDRYNALTWTADQQSLLFNRAEDSDSILWKVPVAGGTPERVGISMNARLKSLSVSPDGKRLAFDSTESDDNEVWALENFLPAASAKK